MPVRSAVSRTLRTVCCCFYSWQEQPESLGSNSPAESNPAIESPAEATGEPSEQTQSPATEQEPTSPETPNPEALPLPEVAPDSSPRTMFSPLSLFRIQQATTDLESLRSILSQSPTARTFAALRPQVQQIIRGDEVLQLFGPDGDTYVTERLRLCETVLEIAYWDVDSGDRRLSAWVERGLTAAVEGEFQKHLLISKLPHESLLLVVACCIFFTDSVTPWKCRKLQYAGPCMFLYCERLVRLFAIRSD
ncbi:hypothetical protein ABW19_dt0200725 [Dactylella cylindrospora]|nr:hypothetical protein ABW19_dt0200725 [Dactylella cylindrospora]